VDECLNTRSSLGERGFSLIEVLIAVFLMTVGIAATIGVLGASGRTTLGAQRSNVATQQAQAEIEKLSTLSYGQLALTSAPPASSDPSNPASRVTGSSFAVGSGLSEQLVLTAGAGQTAMVDPGPQSFSVGTGGAVVTGKIYRFISWHDERCPNSLCDGTQNTKRVTVAVTLDASPTQAARAPLWISSLIADKDTTPPGTSAAAASHPTVTAQSFYLYDTGCGQTEPQPQTGSHVTHDTASSGTTPASDSTCENPDASKQPDLMGPSLPAGSSLPVGSSSTPLYDYSSDLSEDRPGGLAMIHRGTTCDTSYAASNATSATVPNEWSIHAWNTNPFASTFHLSGQVTMSLFTTTIGGAAGRGVVCASLVDRQVVNGVRQDRALGSFVYDLSSWPTSPRRLTFTFDLSQAQDVAAGHRLVLVLQAKGESDNDPVLLYDHPDYPSLLEVATSTPLAPQ
jgi:prepilin-type N-terminal cleavage/methylation domain-containing protein